MRLISNIPHPTPAPPTGVSLLPRTLLGVEPDFFYRANGVAADVSTWDAEFGSQLTLTGSGDSPSIVSSELRDGSRGVQGAGAKYFVGPTDSIITTEHIVFEAVLKMPTATGYMFAKYNSADSGFGLYATTTTVVFNLHATALVQVGSPTITAGSLVHIIGFMKRDGSGVIHANAVAGTPVDISEQSGSVDTTSVPLTALARTGGAVFNGGAIYTLGLWTPTLTSHINPTIASRRYALTGIGDL